MARFHHIGITVSDSAQAAAFYAAITDGQVIGPLVKSGPGVEAATGHPGAEVVLTFIQVTDGVFIELAEYRGAAAVHIDPDNGHVGAAHPAIVVDDIDAGVARAAALGYRTQSTIQTASAGPLEGCRYVYVLGPDGVRVELLQEPHDGPPPTSP